MKRDLELIRKILINVQNGDKNALVEGYDEDAIKYHEGLVVEAGLVEGSVLRNNMASTEIPVVVMIKKLTWEGHDFVDAIEDNENWAKVKAFIGEAGKQISLETVKYAVHQLFTFGAT